MVNGIIYCTTNLVNGKKYIGQDSRNNPEYLGSSAILSRAIKKYGRENFEKEILQDSITLKEDLDEAEIYWIDYFGAVKSDLFYNISSGGTGGELGPEVRKIQSESAKKRVVSGNGNFFKKGIGSKPYAHKISESKTGVSWSQERRRVFEKTDKSLLKYNSKEVYQLDFYFNLIKIWETVSSASEFIGNKRGSDTLANHCRKLSKSFNIIPYRGFYWMYKEDYEKRFRK